MANQSDSPTTVNFFIKVSNCQPLASSLKVKRLLLEGKVKDYPENTLIISGENDHTVIEVNERNNTHSVIIGDPIYHENNFKGGIQANNINILGQFIREVDGFYYIISWCGLSKNLIIASSIFSILPVYYTNVKDYLYISSSFDLLRQTNDGAFTICRQYILEKALFNYPFLDRTPIAQIKTVPSNSSIEFDGTLDFKKHTSISDYFIPNPQKWRSSLDYLSNLFIQESKGFLPDEKFCATLTGGLDGRTVIALALSSGKSLYAYSYGTDQSDDVKIPMEISRKMGLNYRPFLIDEYYARNLYWDNGLDFLFKTNGLGNISRSHYSYAAKSILTDTKYLLTGNFGSEIIRSMKIPGVMTSRFLFDIFTYQSIEKLRSLLLSHTAVRYLTTDLVNANVDELLNDIKVFRASLPAGLTDNQKFYVYLFEQVFPKYFGPEIVFQSGYFNHRAPFLCFRFIKELLKTQVAGVNSSFMETNPFKRYRGQILYAHIIKKTTPALLKFRLDKNYAPQDFLTTFGPVLIGKGYLDKKLRFSGSLSSPAYSRKNFKESVRNFNQGVFDGEFFNNDEIRRKVNEYSDEDPMDLINTISSAIYLNQLKLFSR